MKGLEIQRQIPVLVGLSAPRLADEKTIRLCEAEEDAIAVAIALSGLTQAEIAQRMGVTGAYLTLMKQGHRYMNSRRAAQFADATGWDVLRQYRAMQMAMRMAMGTPRESDRITHIASFTNRRAA